MHLWEVLDFRPRSERGKKPVSKTGKRSLDCGWNWDALVDPSVQLAKAGALLFAVLIPASRWLSFGVEKYRARASLRAAFATWFGFFVMF